MNYRPEIDGLRALAVVPVILFHGGFPGFDGGFVGVDVFFVISGFLITGILAADLEKRRFSLIDFYERRARRILPALFVVVIACVPFAWAWLLPRDFLDFSQSVVAVITFWSNVLFWRESGYFSTAAELKPLLHTWSLAVEEQFYLVFPLVLWMIWGLGQRRVLLILGVLLLISLGLAEWAIAHAPIAGFYLLPTRGWELLIGSLAALVVRRGRVRFSGAVAELMGLSGLVLLAWSVVTFDRATPFPGLNALVPTLGALLLIIPARRPTLAHRLLSARPMVGVGLVSYSAYLWHQPLFAFARYRSFGEPSETLMLFLALLSFALAYVTWRFVETPFRNRSRVSRDKVFRGSMAIGVVLCSFGVIGWALKGVPSRLDMPSSVKASMARSERQTDCFDKPGLHEIDDWTCPLGRTDTAPRFLVFGDSHALSFLDVLNAAARQANVSGAFSGASACTPFLGIHALRKDQDLKNCNAANKRLLDHAKASGVDHVILIARWTFYTDGGYSGKDLSYIGRAADSARSRAESRAAFEHGLDTTLSAYRNAGIGLTLIAQVPQQVMDPMLAYGKAYTGPAPGDALAKLSVTRRRHRALQSFVTDLFDRYNAPLLDLTDILCDGGLCRIGTLDTSFYFDDDHLSIAGATRTQAAFVDLIEGLAVESP